MTAAGAGIRVKLGTTSIVGWLTAAAGMIPIVVRLVEEGGKGLVLGGPERYGAIAAIVLGGIVSLGRYWQAFLIAQTGSTWRVIGHGITTVVAVATVALTAIPEIVRLCEEGARGLTLAGPEKYTVLLGITQAAILLVGKYLQAGALAVKGIA